LNDGSNGYQKNTKNVLDKQKHVPQKNIIFTSPMKQEDFSGAQNILWLDALPKYTNDS